ncbi:ribosome-inactivating family protein [Dysgonomonas sp. 25]|uniref:ribosome-inactivating family protein n=1 Tax=Dysgonomonas sp. 25 TaxID=2302933 RepID=UPI0013D36E4C|nr:ribosome-inactivating family protein [Dysgonomonas sp. 25]NDV69279.1 hypothetical protein [Dysgonomonas sp. 25]
MNSRTIRDILHTGSYNNGGITEIWLLDIRDFVSYRFRDDGLYNSCYVEKINSRNDFIQLGAVDESYFTETQSNGLYRQELWTYVRTVEGTKSADLLAASLHNYLVVFRNTQGRTYCFGSDGGASLTFGQQSGKVGEVTGYQITLNKESAFPLFELNPDGYNTVNVLGTEAEQAVLTENGMNTIAI